MEDWTATENVDHGGNGNVIHVLPIGDLVEHDCSAESGDDCVCQPQIEPVRTDDGADAWVVLHHSLDGREHDEPDHDRDECPVCQRDPA